MDAVRLVFCEATALHYTLPECGSTQRVNALKSGHRVKYKTLQLIAKKLSCEVVALCAISSHDARVCARVRVQTNDERSV